MIQQCSPEHSFDERIMFQDLAMVWRVYVGLVRQIYRKLSGVDKDAAQEPLP